MSAFVPSITPYFPQYVSGSIGVTGDISIVQGISLYRIVVTNYVFSGNGLDQIVTIKTGNSNNSGQSNVALIPWTVGPNAAIPGVSEQRNLDGLLATNLVGAPHTSNTVPDDLVLNVAGTNGNSTINLSYRITFELRLNVPGIGQVGNQ